MILDHHGSLLQSSGGGGAVSILLASALSFIHAVWPNRKRCQAVDTWSGWLDPQRVFLGSALTLWTHYPAIAGWINIDLTRNPAIAPL